MFYDNKIYVVFSSFDGDNQCLWIAYDFLSTQFRVLPVAHSYAFAAK